MSSLAWLNVKDYGATGNGSTGASVTPMMQDTGDNKSAAWAVLSP